MNKFRLLGYTFYVLGYIICILEIILWGWHFPFLGFIIGCVGSVFLNIEEFKNNS